MMMLFWVLAPGMTDDVDGVSLRNLGVYLRDAEHRRRMTVDDKMLMSESVGTGEEQGAWWGRGGLKRSH